MQYNNVAVGPSEIFVHPLWIAGHNSCAVPPSSADLALVRFPKGTYTGSEFARLHTDDVKAGQDAGLVGFGNNVNELLNRHCYLVSRIDPEDGTFRCSFQQATRQPGNTYAKSDLYSYSSPTDSSQSSRECVTPCKQASLIAYLTAQQKSYDEILNSQCDGNYGPQIYRESGLGIKRSGLNKIERIANGVIEIGGTAQVQGDVNDVVLGGGDSGGPLLALTPDKKNAVVGVASATASKLEGTDSAKEHILRSMFTALRWPQNRAWLNRMIWSNGLDSPQKGVSTP